MSTPVVTFLTDYGPASEHVGALHAVVAAAAPQADRIDFAHDIAPGEVLWGATVLARLVALIPDAIHVAVVDPGVGTARRALAVQTERGFLIGPDNGLLALAADTLRATTAVELPVAQHVPATFHGRDVFAPAAARLAAGERLGRLGDDIDLGGVTRPETPEVMVRPGRLESAVVLWDRFGNIQLGADGDHLHTAAIPLGAPVTITFADQTMAATHARAFGDALRGALIVHVDAHGQVALSVNRGDAAAMLGVACGDRVTIRAERR